MGAMRLDTVCFTFILLLLQNSIFARDILDLCFEECKGRALPDDDAFDGDCNIACQTERCSRGCKLWSTAAASSCQGVCNSTSTSPSQSLHCVVGCSIGLAFYVQNLKEEIGIPPAPYLVANTLKNDSLAIQWALSIYENISYLIQWKYDSSSSNWEYYDAENPLKNNTVQITGLHSYTKYKFRVAWLLLPFSSAHYSEESVVISTLPSGVPSTSPTLTSVTPVGPTSVSISWNAPSFPNGRILAYVIQLREINSGILTVKEWSDFQGGLHFMFNNLKPSTNYSVSISTRNAMGEGPEDTKTVKTPKISNGPQSSIPQLILAARDSILQHGINIYDEPSVLYQPVNNTIEIMGMALHVKLGLLFVSDSLGSVHRIPLQGGAKRMDTVILESPNNPSILSIDWLNDKLYILEDNRISRCDLSGDFLETVINGLTTPPSDIRVDPHKGYIFWVVREDMYGTLYRLDLDQISSTTVPQQEAKLITRIPRLTSFAIDHRNFRLLVPKATSNTVLSLALDGSDLLDIRNNSQRPQFTNVNSLSYHHGVFFWTTGTEILGEEYHLEEDKYFHNAFPLKDVYCTAVRVWHPSSQPYPVPLNPVENVQAVFKDESAKISWEKPRRLGGIGFGAWQKWLFEVHLYDEDKGLTIHDSNITKTAFTIHNLKPNTTYTVQVKAYSYGGKGPWSTKFVGKTIRAGSSSESPYILWGANDGLLRSDVIGDNVERLVPDFRLEGAHIKNIAWYKDLVFMNTNNSRIYSFNCSSFHPPIKLSNITNAVSVAVDWLAPKLYWSSPVHQLISRANLDGSHPEPLPILTVAKELAVDAPGGRLYWATAYSVECARLNGEERHSYFETKIFSGKHVMGLTLDFDRHKVYWMVRSHEGAVLYGAKQACDGCTELNESIENLGSLPQKDVRGPLWYFSDHLYWLHELKEALISDLNGQNVANLRGLSSSGLRSLTVVDSSLHPQPRLDKGEAIVVPTKIKRNLISFNGTHDNFDILWQPVSNVNYGKIFYELRLDDGREIISLVTEDSSFNYRSSNHPYTPMTLALRAFTYWGSSRMTVVSFHTPMSIPSEPTHPRVFISYKLSPYSKNRHIEAEFRWSVPKHPNGRIEGYLVKWWYGPKSNNKVLRSLDGDQLSLRLFELQPDTTYYFQVLASTEAGEGPYSDTIEGRTSEEHPIPKLLLAKTDSIKVADVDAHEEQLLSNKVTQPVAIAFLSETNFVYWLEEGGTLMSSSLDGLGTSLVRKLNGIGTGIAVDWVGRYLYWSEKDRVETQSTVWKMDLNNKEEPRIILNKTNEINSVEIDPFTSMLLWTATQESGKIHLMASNTDGSNIRNFFLHPWNYQPVREYRSAAANHKRNTRKHCDCPTQPSVGPTVAIDRSNPKKPEVIWVDGILGHIWAADMQGCICRMVVNSTYISDSGLPPTSITADKSKIYWSNSAVGRVFSVDKDEKRFLNARANGHHRPVPAAHRRSAISSEMMKNIRGIRAIGDHLQPYPDHSCLSPLPYTNVPLMTQSAPNSLTLELGDTERPLECNRISMASVLYTIYYGKIHENGTVICNDELLDDCLKENTYNKSITLKNLEPFTNYTVFVAVSNYFNQFKVLPVFVGVFHTSEGAPSAPVGVSAFAISPTRIDVFWRPPVIPNGDKIWYEVRWHTADQPGHSQTERRAQDGNEELSDEYVMHLNSLAPNSEHFIQVKAYSKKGDMYSDSLEVRATTFDIPNNLTLYNVSSTSLILQWVSPGDGSVVKHGLEYSEVGTVILGNKSVQPTSPNTVYYFELTGLNPKETYLTKLRLIYNKSNVTFYWPSKELKMFSFQTLGDVPGVPGVPEVRTISRNVYTVVWEEAPRNGGEDLFYELQLIHLTYPQSPQKLVIEEDPFEERNSSSTNETYLSSYSPLAPTVPLDVEDSLNLVSTSNWLTVYNGSQHQWIIEGIPSQARYEFRVRAVTEYGGGNYSAVGAGFFLPEPGAITEPAREQTEVILIAVLSASAFIVLSLFAALYFVQKRREKDSKALQAAGQPIHGPDVELATLRELPHHGNFVHQNNELYAAGDIPTDEELCCIPHISRKQIGLTKFLGSGAFGEVFEGTASDLEENGMPAIKVAIKTLRKGATDQEKTEFLKEAKLMSNFKHEHILKLLGICLNNDPNFIILELMEGGDLLSYLRFNRPTTVRPCSLTFYDLLSICVDVAQGCKYLEEMHFVHRDLAARNCLVSSRDPALRIVKIGDFGLARDIYKNDYYRKEGEGLLPVRWMAPESLVDGVFTSQSDIWAFGVLLWEVMTLGQQPYPARTNLEVLHYVRGGGRLDKPANCPNDLHDLMTKCWSYSPEHRPSFTRCLQTLQDLKHRNSTQANTIVPQNYIGRYYDEELEKLRDTVQDHRPLLSPRLPSENGTNTNNPNSTTANLQKKTANSNTTSPLLSVSSSSDAGASGSNPSREPAKYLELLADTECPTDAEGYELPLPLLPTVALERLKKLDPPTNYSPMSSGIKPNFVPSSPSPLKGFLPPTCLTNGRRFGSPTTIDAGRRSAGRDNYLSRNKIVSYRGKENGFGSSPVVTSALLKTNSGKSRNASAECCANIFDSEEECETTETSNPFLRRALSSSMSSSVTGLTCTPSCHRCSPLDSPCARRMDGSDCWSLSSASTAAIQDSKRNSGISTLSAVSGVELNYTPKSSWC